MDSFVAKNWSNLIKPVALETVADTLKANYGKFVAKPLERGYGQTLGNSLRRVLLSSLPPSLYRLQKENLCAPSYI